jgi:hypothetical protein
MIHEYNLLLVGRQQAVFQPFQSSREVLADHGPTARPPSASCVADISACSTSLHERQRSREARMISPRVDI